MMKYGWRLKHKDSLLNSPSTIYNEQLVAVVELFALTFVVYSL